MPNKRIKTRLSEPTEIKFKNMRFLITDSPTDRSLEEYNEMLMKYLVKDVVRVCDPTYVAYGLEKKGYKVWDLPFEDGSAPPSYIIGQWFHILRIRFEEEPGCCIAVHCIAGLGRAPVLVALALMEAGLKYEDAIEMIRQKRRGAFNTKQISYLAKYCPKSRLKTKTKTKKRRCVIQ